MSSYKKSKESVLRNAESWSKNLPPTSKKLKRCNDIVLVDKNLAAFVRLPLKMDILGRFKILLLDEYDAWSSIQMIVCDTTPVNTGRLNGVVVQIQKEILRKGFPEPQYIGCQHHILDRILKHVLDFFLFQISLKNQQ